MAHYAKLGLDNVVDRVIVLRNIDCMTEGGIEKEEIAQAFIKNDFGSDATWIKCSYNTHDGVHNLGGTPLRANFPDGHGGWYYDSSNDIFHPKRPKDKDGEYNKSWTLNTTTGKWKCPLGWPPELSSSERAAGKSYVWDESAYQADNTKGWVLDS